MYILSKYRLSAPDAKNRERNSRHCEVLRKYLFFGEVLPERESNGRRNCAKVIYTLSVYVYPDLVRLCLPGPVKRRAPLGYLIKYRSIYFIPTRNVARPTVNINFQTVSMVNWYTDVYNLTQ